MGTDLWMYIRTRSQTSVYEEVMSVSLPDCGYIIMAMKLTIHFVNALKSGTVLWWVRMWPQSFIFVAVDYYAKI